VRVRIDETGKDRLARDVDDRCAARYVDSIRGSDRDDSIALDQDSAGLDNLIIDQRDEAGTAQSYHALRTRSRHTQVNGERPRLELPYGLSGLGGLLLTLVSGLLLASFGCL
jgi:hypothetical protein